MTDPEERRKKEEVRGDRVDATENFKLVKSTDVGTEREKTGEDEEREAMYLCAVDSEELLSACPARVTSYNSGNSIDVCSAWWTEEYDGWIRKTRNLFIGRCLANVNPASIA